MTASAMPRSRMAAAAPAAGDFGFAAGFADIFDEMFGDFMGQRRGGGGGGNNRGNDLRYNLEISLEDAFKGKQTTIRVTTLAPCEACSGNGAAPGSQAGQLPDLPGQRPGPRAAGLLHHRAHLPRLPRRRARHRQSLPRLRRPGPRAQGEDARGHDPGRGRGRHAHPPGRRGRGRRARRRAGRSLHLPRGEAARHLPARRRQHPLPRADLDADRGARRRDRGARRSTAAAPSSTIPAGTQSGHQFRLRSKGMSVLRSAARGDMYVEVIVETPVNLTKRQQELLREFEQGRRAQPHPSGKRRLLRQGEGVLRGPARIARVACNPRIAEVRLRDQWRRQETWARSRRGAHAANLN